jgi:hypothetical protein
MIKIDTNQTLEDFVLLVNTYSTAMLLTETEEIHTSNCCGLVAK